MAYGAQPAASRRESREHPATLGRIGPAPLGLSTGLLVRRWRQSEEELDELDEEPDVLGDELDAAVLEAEEPDDESEDEEDEPLEPDVAGVEDDEAARLSVR